MSPMESEPFDLLWRALANPIRRRILDLLRDRSRTTGELVASFPDLSRFAVMQHLDVLVEANLVLVRREGRHRLNALNPIPLQQLYERWVNRHASRGAEMALRLKRHIEEESEEQPQMETKCDRVVKIEMEVAIAAPPERVFAALTTELDAWWGFRFRPDSRVVYEPWVGGRCYETWAEGQGALYGMVTHFEPPSRIGSRGPGALPGAYTSTTWQEIEPRGEGSVCKWSMRIWGEVPEEMEAMFTQGTRSILEGQLRAYLEEGKRFQPGD